MLVIDESGSVCYNDIEIFEIEGYFLVKQFPKSVQLLLNNDDKIKDGDKGKLESLLGVITLLVIWLFSLFFLFH
jgi:hypothetical protein